MAMIPQRLVAGSQLTTSAATYYTAPANTRTIIRSLTLTNTSAAAVTATLHLISAGASETTSNMVIQTRTLAIAETYTCPEAAGFVLLATGTIRALASATTAITIMASGSEWTG